MGHLLVSLSRNFICRCSVLPSYLFWKHAASIAFAPCKTSCIHIATKRHNFVECLRTVDRCSEVSRAVVCATKSSNSALKRCCSFSRRATRASRASWIVEEGCRCCETSVGCFCAAAGLRLPSPGDCSRASKPREGEAAASPARSMVSAERSTGKVGVANTATGICHSLLRSTPANCSSALLA